MRSYASLSLCLSLSACTEQSPYEDVAKDSRLYYRRRAFSRNQVCWLLGLEVLAFSTVRQ